MKLTMLQQDITAIERGMKKHNVVSKGFLKIVDKWVEDNKEDKESPQYKLLLRLQECTKTYIEWGM